MGTTFRKFNPKEHQSESDSTMPPDARQRIYGFDAMASLVKPEDDGHNDQSFDRLVGTSGGNETPARNGGACRFIEALEIATFFDVDRNRPAIGANPHAQMHPPLFAQAAGGRRVRRSRIVQVGGVETRRAGR